MTIKSGAIDSHTRAIRISGTVLPILTASTIRVVNAVWRILASILPVRICNTVWVIRIGIQIPSVLPLAIVDSWAVRACTVRVIKSIVRLWRRWWKIGISCDISQVILPMGSWS